MNEVERLSRKVRDLERRLGEIPSRWKQPTMNPLRIKIGGGNDLTIGGGLGTHPGIKYIYSAPSSAPTKYDPETNPSCIDGIGWGSVIINGDPKYKVLVGLWQSPFWSCMIENQNGYAFATEIIPVDGGDDTITVYMVTLF